MSLCLKPLMSSIVQILKSGRPRLFAVRRAGRRRNPVEGAALAIAIIQENRKALIPPPLSPS
ncbi:MAG: hypothetical protein ACLUIX_10675 [Oscillospiraceae bacterium]